jgi:hypothetical protein
MTSAVSRTTAVTGDMTGMGMTRAAQAVADAHEVVTSGMPRHVDPQVLAAVYATILREFLANPYERDLSLVWQPHPLASG